MVNLKSTEQGSQTSSDPLLASKMSPEKKNLRFLWQKTKTDNTRLLVLATRVLLLFALVLGYFILNMFIFKPKRPVLIVSDSEVTAQDVLPSEIVIPPTKTFDEYVEIINKRDIFNPPDSKQPGVLSEDLAPVPAIDLRASYRLVGILLDKDPRAVVEDLKTQETLFLSKGQKIGDITVEDIADGKVVFISNGQHYELTP